MPSCFSGPVGQAPTNLCDLIRHHIFRLPLISLCSSIDWHDISNCYCPKLSLFGPLLLNDLPSTTRLVILVRALLPVPLLLGPICCTD